MASITKIKGKKRTTYRAQVRRSGYATEAKTFDDEQKAKDWAYDKERDIRDRTADPKSLAKRKTVTAAVELYLSKIDHKSSASVNRYVKKTVEAARAAQAKR